MLQQKKIIVDIDEKGNCSIEGEGFVGTECAHFIGEIEAALGQRISQRDKPEYNQRQTYRGKNKNRQIGGR